MIERAGDRADGLAAQFRGESLAIGMKGAMAIAVGGREMTVQVGGEGFTAALFDHPLVRPSPLRLAARGVSSVGHA